MASLTIVRDSGFTDRRRNYQVLLDGNKAGQIGHAETKRFPVSQGRHKLRLKIDWCGSREVEFDAKETEELIFRVTNLQNLIGVLGCVFLSPSSYLKLRQISTIAK
jgi:hypothetical protein